MKMIGKMDGLPVFEVDRGKYVMVNPEMDRCFTMWSWFAQLGKWSDTFIKCKEDESELKCLDIIEADKEEIVKNLNSYEGKIQSESGQEMLESQDEFYDWLEEGREFNWFDGYTDEIEDD